MILAPDQQTHAADNEEKGAVERFLEEYDENQQERKLKAEIIKPSTFQGLHAVLWELGFYLYRAPNEDAATPTARKAREKMLEKMPLEDAESEAERAALEKFRRLVDVIKNAEYLSSELESLQVDITPPRDFTDFSPGTELPLGYNSPAIIRLTFDTNEMYYLSAKKAGYTDDELELIFGHDQDGKLLPPRGHRQKNRSRGSLTSWSLPMPEDEWNLYSEFSNIHADSASTTPKDFFQFIPDRIQQRVASVLNLEIVIHGFTGDENMARSRQPEIETDLAEAYFANLTPEEQQHAAVLAWRKLGPFDETVDMKNGYGPFDYAQEIAMDLSATGFTHQEAGQEIPHKTALIKAHSMGGEAAEHLVINYLNQMLKNPHIDWTIGMFNPARVGKVGEQVLSTHHWSNAAIGDEDEKLFQQLARRGTALMLQGGQRALKNIIVEGPGKIVGQRVSKAIGAIYRYPEALVATQLTNLQLLKNEPCRKLVKGHLDRLLEDTPAATFTGVGSNHDIPVTMEEVENLFHDERPNHKEFYVSADGPNIKDEMVNTKKTLQALPPDVPLFVLPDGTHYAFKWRSNQLVVDTLEHTALRLDRGSWQYLMQLVQELYQERKQRHFADLSPSFIFDWLGSLHVFDLADHVGLDGSILKDYLNWREEIHSLVLERQDELNSINTDLQLSYFKEAKQQVDPDFKLDLRHIYSSQPDGFLRRFQAVRQKNHGETLSSEELSQLGIVEQMLRFLDICGNLAHFNDPEDPVITRDFSSLLPERVQQRNRKLHLMLFFVLSVSHLTHFSV